MSKPTKAGPGLPADSAWLFPEYAFEEMDQERYRGVIIERFLERGTWEQTRWLFATYGEEQVAAWVRMSLSHYTRLGNLPAADRAQLRSEKRDNRDRLTVQRYELNFIPFAILMDQDDGANISLF